MSSPVPPTRRHALRTLGGLGMGLLPSASAASVQGSTREKERCLLDGRFDPPADRGRSIDFLDARSFGARFDGSTDDADALQRAVDAAHAAKRALHLPGGTAVMGKPLKLVRREVRIIGAGMDATILRAGKPLASLIDAEESEDKIISPLEISHLSLDGAGQTQRNLAIRYRHYTVFDTINSIGATVGFWERDCWLSRRFNCRTGDNGIGWHLVGSNHSSIWQGCTFTACRDAHLRIGNQGTAPDGNAALLFRNCDVEFGTGHGIEIDPGITATFDTCYLGEAIEGDVIRNRGFVLIRGGILFFGARAGVGIRPLGGRAFVDGATVNSQGAGLISLVNLSAAEAADPGAGKAGFRTVDTNVAVGGVPILQGDPLDRVPMTTFAPRLGRDWRVWSRSVSVEPPGTGDAMGDGRLVTCRALTGPAPLMGLSVRLFDERWRQASPPFIAIVYAATRPVMVRLSPAPGQEPAHFLFELPASQGLVTAICVTATAPATGFGHIDLMMVPSPRDRLHLHEVTLADGSVVRAGSGNLATLALAQ